MADESTDQGDTESSKREEESRDGGDAGEREDAVQDSEEETDDDDEDEEEDEPKLKYARMTSQLASVYRNGDATSCFLVGGDKMVRSSRKSGLGNLLNDVMSRSLEHIMETL